MNEELKISTCPTCNTPMKQLELYILEKSGLWECINDDCKDKGMQKMWPDDKD